MPPLIKFEFLRVCLYILEECGACPYLTVYFYLSTKFFCFRVTFGRIIRVKTDSFGFYPQNRMSCLFSFITHAQLIIEKSRLSN